MTVRESRSSGRFAATLLVAGFAIGGCTDFAGYDLDYIMGRSSLLATMRNTVSFEPQDLALLPPEGTVAVAGPGAGAPAPFTQAALDSAAATLANPLEPSSEVMARGALVYNNHCAVCHGAQGEGNGTVIGNGRFPQPPNLLGGATAARSDGYIYAIVRVGRGLMPAYGERVDHEDRWAVVHYLRQLQGRQVAAPQPAAAAAAQAAPAAPAAQAAPAAPADNTAPAPAAAPPAEPAPAPQVP